MSLSNLKVLFMGTPAFAVPTLKALAESSCTVIGVVTQPDRPTGRGRKMAAPPVKDYALSEGIQVFQPLKVRVPEVIEEFRALAPDVIVVVAFGQILPKVLLQIPPMGCINVHASLLPAYRGAAPINWAVINGESKTGVTTMFMDEGLDTGDMLLKSEVPIGEEDTSETLYEELSHLGAKLLIETLEGLKTGTIDKAKQDGNLSSYAPLLKKGDGLIDWSLPATDLANRVRGLLPWPVAKSSLKGQGLKVYSAGVGVAVGRPGEVMAAGDDGIEVAAGEGSLIFREIQLEGKKRMLAGDFLKGARLEVGELLGS